ncbi:MAG: glycosyltransferase family 4 protein [Candidatus Gracilibacteria bacterium]|nr:glycosyltransferase family 4 protein [Candidatus Gracilibacteria bacterium]
MIIGIDLRFLDHDLYSQFAKDFVKNLIHTQTQYQFNIYTKNPDLFDLDGDNFHIKYVDIDCGSLSEQIKLKKIFEKDNNTLMLFFDHHKPVGYKGEYYTVLSGLKDIFYQNYSNYFSKYKYLYLLEKNLKNSKKILCFDHNTKKELIERFNAEEESIIILQPFFIKNNDINQPSEVEISMRSKFQLGEKYLIYSGGDGIEKNLDRLIQVFHRLHKEEYDLHLVFFGDKIGKNIDLRHAIIEHDLQKKVHFLDALKPAEEKCLYEQSQGVVFPSLYESFPFRLSHPLFLGTPILTSKLVNTEKVFGDKVSYFSPISTGNIITALKDFVEKKHVIDYEKIRSEYTVIHTVNQFIKIIR